MRLVAGQKAPDFETVDVLGRPVRLADYRGGRLMLSFYRYASCPLCNMRVHDLIGRVEDWSQRGLSVLGVFQSPAESIARYVGRQNAPFPIVADPGHGLYRLYGVESSLWAFLLGSLRLKTVLAATGRGFLPGKMEGTITMVPADFLIGPELVIEKAFYGQDIGDHLPVAEVEAWLNGGK